MDLLEYTNDLVGAARRASFALAKTSGGTRNAALEAMARGFEESTDRIVEANAKDIEAKEMTHHCDSLTACRNRG